jgi:uncharacterized membrane protein
MSERPERGSPTRTLEAETAVGAPIEAVFDLLVDVPRYVEFSEYLQSVETHGDGGPGTVYRLRFEWWRLSYTAVSRVLSIDRPRRIEWEVVEDVDARGSWNLQAVDGSGEAVTTDVTLAVEYVPGSVTPDVLDVPRFVSFDTVLAKAAPLVEREARTVLERLVATLEGEPRPIDLEIRHG